MAELTELIQLVTAAAWLLCALLALVLVLYAFTQRR